MGRLSGCLLDVLLLVSTASLVTGCSRPPSRSAYGAPLDAQAQSEILKYVDERYPHLLAAGSFDESEAARVSQSVRALLEARPTNEWAPSVVLLVEERLKDGAVYRIELHWLMWKDRMPPNITLGKGDRVLAKITYPDGWWDPVPVFTRLPAPVLPIATSSFFPEDSADAHSMKSGYVVDYLAMISRDDAAAPGDWWIQTESGQKYDFLVEHVVIGGEP